MKRIFFVGLVFGLWINLLGINPAVSEEENYKTTIKPKTFKKGIETGEVFLYGHYIKPPYRVTTKVDRKSKDIHRKYRTLINGIPIHPKLHVLQKEERKITPEEKRISKEVFDTSLKLRLSYYEWVKEYGGKKAIEMVVELAKEQDSITNAYQAAKRGAIWIEWKYFNGARGIDLNRDFFKSYREMKKEAKKEQISEKKFLKETIEKGLKEGIAFIFDNHGNVRRNKPIKDRIKKIMESKEGTMFKKSELKKIISSNEKVIYSLIYNYNKEEYE